MSRVLETLFPRKTRWRLLSVPLFYLLILIMVYLLQERLLYHPSTLSRADAERVAASNAVDIWGRVDGEVHGYVANDTAEALATVVVFHGNAGNALDRMYYVKALAGLGYRVILAEYPGYGSRPGALNEASLVDDGVATVQEVSRRYAGKVIVWGESLGCGIATGVIRKLPGTVSGAVLLTPWNNLPAIAQATYWFLPVKWLCRDTYDNVANLENFTGPVVCLIAGEDRIIAKIFSREVYDSYNGPKHLIQFNDAGHNSWPARSQLPWWQETMDFVNS